MTEEPARKRHGRGGSLRASRLISRLWLLWFAVPALAGVSIAGVGILEVFLTGRGDPRDDTFAMLHEAIPAIMPVWLTGLIVIALIYRLARQIGVERPTRRTSGTDR